MEGTKKHTAEDVVASFENLLKVYELFRLDNGLGDSPKINGFEICTALMDKNGRIARHIKHFERNDPKKDWPDGMVEAITGWIVYVMMMINSMDLDASCGMTKELQSGLKQYSN